MARHFLELADAATIPTEAYLLTRRTVADVYEAGAMGAPCTARPALARRSRSKKRWPARGTSRRAGCRSRAGPRCAWWPPRELEQLPAAMLVSLASSLDLHPSQLFAE